MHVGNMREQAEDNSIECCCFVFLEEVAGTSAKWQRVYTCLLEILQWDRKSKPMARSIPEVRAGRGNHAIMRHRRCIAIEGFQQLTCLGASFGPRISFC